jgi:hypothetical protein
MNVRAALLLSWSVVFAVLAAGCAPPLGICVDDKDCAPGAGCDPAGRCVALRSGPPPIGDPDDPLDPDDPGPADPDPLEPDPDPPDPDPDPDPVPPTPVTPPLVAFTAEAVPEAGALFLSWELPTDTSRYVRIELRRALGGQAPACDDGVLVTTLAAPFVDGDQLDAGLAERVVYSYRACITDVDNDVLDDATAGPIATRGCVVENTHVRQLTGVRAAVQDAWWRQFGSETSPAAHAPALLSFAARAVTPGDRLSLTTATGNTICRIRNSGDVECHMPCPQQWKLFFHRADNSIILDDGLPEDVGAFVAGVVVPPGATSITVGYRDHEAFNCQNAGKCCTTGQTCDPESLYFDNEGNRSTTSDLSTSGCSFGFALEQRSCD